MADWNCCLDEDIPDELPDIGGEPGVPSALHDHPPSAQENSLEVVKPREIVRKQKVGGQNEIKFNNYNFANSLNKNKYSRHALALSSQHLLLPTICYTSTCNTERRKITKYLHIIEYRAVSIVFQTMKSAPSPHSECVLLPHTRWAVRGQYFGRRQTLD
jgi:hypothetical protein